MIYCLLHDVHDKMRIASKNWIRITESERILTFTIDRIYMTNEENGEKATAVWPNSVI